MSQKRKGNSRMRGSRGGTVTGRAARAPARKPLRRQRGRYLRARTEGIRLVNRLAFGLLTGMVCVAVALLAVPQVRTLQRMEDELAQAEARELEALELKDRKARELAALKDDHAYLELVARDRLDLYVPGERVVRFRRARR